MILRLFFSILAYSLLACDAWAFGGPGTRIWLPEGVSTTAPLIDHLFYVILWITGVAFVLVQVTLVVFLIKYRRREGKSAAYIHGNHLAEIIWTAIPALILVGLTYQSQQVWAKVRGTPPPADMHIEVTAEQFAWNIRYAGADQLLNTADDIITINQMHLPVNKTVQIHLKSKDVLHSFFVPQFRMKLDAVPGITGRLWVNAVKSGNYEIACAELCGLGHYRMRGYLVIESNEAFDQWLVETLAEQNA